MAGSSAGIQVAVAGVMRCDPGDTHIDQEQSGRCRMWPVRGSKIGNVGSRGWIRENVRCRILRRKPYLAIESRGDPTGACGFRGYPGLSCERGISPRHGILHVLDVEPAGTAGQRPGDGREHSHRRKSSGLQGRQDLSRCGALVTMFSILHLSDLHRSEAEPISNETLIASLQADCDRFAMETPMIRQPDAIVVSGDIVLGASPGQPDFANILKVQYELAQDFLVRLTERLFAGDRSRVVLVPGNHDCCWNTAFSGMTLVEEKDVPVNLLGELETPNSPLRWNWRERRLYRISKWDAYARRLDSYWDFVDGFYKGHELKFPIRRDTGYNLFELDGGRILVAAFESLHGNDCFSYQGRIDPTTIADAALHIRDEGGRYSLLTAVWHHGLHCERSYRSDYVSINTVYDMIGHGFQLALHGHQHFAEIGSHYVRVPGDREIAIVSAGSLCAGSKDLPRGINRQYRPALKT